MAKRKMDEKGHVILADLRDSAKEPVRLTRTQGGQILLYGWDAGGQKLKLAAYFGKKMARELGLALLKEALR